MYIYIYIYVYTYLCIYIYIYTYSTHTQRTKQPTAGWRSLRRQARVRSAHDNMSEYNNIM